MVGPNEDGLRSGHGLFDEASKSMLQSILRHAAPAALVLLFVSASSSLRADEVSSGFALAPLPYPGGAATATLSSGDVIAFDGLTVRRYDENGLLLQDLASFPGFVFPSFVLADPGESFVVVSESSFGVIYRVDLAAGGLVTIAQLNFNYDAVFEDAGHLLVSAATCGFGCGNELWRVDVLSGASVQVATLSGASGPLIGDGNGHLFYGTVSAVFPPPPGASEVLCFELDELTGSPVVDETSALVVGSGFEAAFDLAFDSARGDLFIAEVDFSTGVNRIQRVESSAGLSPLILEGTPFHAISNLEFVAGDGKARFAAFQPASGGRLRYNTTDFVASFERNAIEPLRPGLLFSGPGTTGPGDVTVQLLGGPPLGLALIAYGPRALAPQQELAIELAGVDAPLFIGLDLASLELLPSPLALDASGLGTLVTQNPGGFEGLLAVQAIVFDATLRLVCTSEVALF